MSRKVTGNLNFRTVKTRNTAFYDFQVYIVKLKIHGCEGTCFNDYILMFCHLHIR